MKLINYILLIFLLSPLHAHSNITDYTIFVGTAKYNGNSLIVLRKFKENNYIKFLGVNPLNLKTSIFSSDVKQSDWANIKSEFKNSKYIKLLEKSLRNGNLLQNSGITHFENQNCIYLTTDLCPSSKPMEINFYKNIYKQVKQTVPIGIAITGKWIEKHNKELDLLLKLENKKKISVTWINHSYSHFYNKKLPLNKNFLLYKKTNLNYEVLNLEKLLISKGLTPSIFFRFPGLISSKNIFEKISNMGLIILGSNAWIAKNQYPKKGSIVLLHGNGNEHKGIRMFEEWLKKNKNICFGTLGE